MANWFDPASPAVRAVLTGVMLASLLMAAALPEAFGEHGLLFAASYVVLQVGPQRRRGAAAARATTRCATCSSGWSCGAPSSGVLWLAGATLDGDQRLMLWIPALALDLAAPAAGYWLPGRGRAATTDWDIEGGHFAERCQLFIIIALGESIVVTGATASACGPDVGRRGLPRRRVRGDRGAVVAVLRRDGRARARRDEHLRGPGPARARRLHVLPPADRRGDHRDRGRRRSADRRTTRRAARRIGLAIGARRPALFLLGESLFEWAAVGSWNAKRLVAAGLIVALAPLGTQVSALALAIIVTAVLTALAIVEMQAGLLHSTGARLKQTAREGTVR